MVDTSFFWVFFLAVLVLLSGLLRKEAYMIDDDLCLRFEWTDSTIKTTWELELHSNTFILTYRTPTLFSRGPLYSVYIVLSVYT